MLFYAFADNASQQQPTTRRVLSIIWVSESPAICEKGVTFCVSYEFLLGLIRELKLLS